MSEYTDWAIEREEKQRAMALYHLMNMLHSMCKDGAAQHERARSVRQEVDIWSVNQTYRGALHYPVVIKIHRGGGELVAVYMAYSPTGNNPEICMNWSINTGNMESLRMLCTTSENLLYHYWMNNNNN